MRLIDADALMKKRYEIFEPEDPETLFSRSYTHKVVSVDDVKKAPTIDAVSVVRCGECKYCVFHCGEHFCIKLIAFPVVETDDFCSYGERREDDADPVAHARWEINSDGYYPYCSNCKAEPKSGKMTETCPNCGAKMDLEVDGE